MTMIMRADWRNRVSAGGYTPTMLSSHSIPELPDILASWTDVETRILGERRIAVFLDYDGTLTPIVARPKDAVLAEPMRSLLDRLAQVCFVAIVSGRDVDTLWEHIGLDRLVYLGSHGADVLGRDGRRTLLPGAESFLGPLSEAAEHLAEELRDVSGVLVEHKRYALAVHYRNAAEKDVERVFEAMEREAERQPQLRETRGKKVLELRPALDWGKGQAVRALLRERFGGIPSDALGIYLGDDLTDEDAFSELAEDGLTVVVDSGESRPTHARFRVRPEGVSEILRRLAEHCERTATA
ncbi:MAG: trehalose-phosphatase [Coriobacteriia bacterium]